MATTSYFDELIRDQGGSTTVELEFGRSSSYKKDSLYITVDDKLIIVDRETAKRIIKKMNDVARYLKLLDE
jgi:hypothetical protein